MRVATKLAAASALHIGVLTVLLVHHVRTIRDTVSTGYELTEISSRAYHTVSDQAARISQLEENAAKYVVTRDAGYLSKYQELSAAFADVLATLKQQPLSEQERVEIAAIEDHWTAFVVQSRTLSAGGGSASPATDLLLPLQARLDSIREHTRRLGTASQEAMMAQLTRNTSAARRAEQLSWIAGGLVLVVSVIVSAMIIRSITDGLARLAAGTREVAQGRFGHRLGDLRDDEFAQVARDFNTMTIRLGELDRMKRDFISKVSHDLKTPLASMQETIVALLDEVPGPLLPRQRRLLELNRQSGERLYGMLAKLLDLSRLEAGVFAPRLERIHLHELIEDVAEFHSHPDAPVVVESPMLEISLVCDRDRVEQLLHNLVENAVKFASPGGVSIRAVLERQSAGQYRGCRLPAAHIVVQDDGPGVSDDEKERIFERFFQGSAGSGRAPGGVGLGLTICREIVTVHGGAIWVDDRPGGGSRFHVLLPDAQIGNQVSAGFADAGTRETTHV